MLTCWLRSDRIPVTSPAVFSSSARLSLRSLSDLDSRDRPSKVGPNCGAIWSSVVDSVSSDWLSVSVSVPAVLAVSSLTASVKRVRRRCPRHRNELSGGPACRCPPTPGPAPARRAGFRCGCARWCPIRARTLPSMVKVTSASPLSSSIDDTAPTLIPDTVTSLPTTRPPASVNSAWYLTPVAHCSSRSGCRPDGDDEDDQDDADEARPG